MSTDIARCPICKTGFVLREYTTEAGMYRDICIGGQSPSCGWHRDRPEIAVSAEVYGVINTMGGVRACQT